MRLRRGLSNDVRRLGVEVLEHSDSGNVAFEQGFIECDPAYGQTRADGCSQALNDEIIEPPIVDLDLLEIVAEHRHPDLPDPELIKKQREYADAGPLAAGVAAFAFGGAGFLAAGLALAAVGGWAVCACAE